MTNTGRGNPRGDEQAAPGGAPAPGGAGRERLIGARLLPRAEYRYGLVLLLLVVTFVVLMVGSASRWVRPLTVALTGGTLVAALLAADARPGLRRAAAVASVAAFVMAVGGAALGERAG